MEKKLAVVIGAGSGMGVNIAKVFGRHGFRVALLARETYWELYEKRDSVETVFA